MKNLLNCAVKAMKNNKFSLPSGKGLGVRLLTTLLLITLGVGQMWGYTLYLYTGSFTDWENDGVGFRVWTGSENVNFTSLGNHWWSCTTTRTGTMYIKRYSGSTDHNQFTASSVSSTNNVFYVSGWNNSGGALKYYIKHPWDGGSWTWQTMTFNSANTFKYTGIYKSGNGANVNQDKGDSNYLTPSNTSNVNDKVPAIWTYTPSSNSLRIDPAYTLTVTNDGHGSASGSVSKGIKMSTKYSISASSPSTGYHFYNWTRVSGGTCTFDNASSASTKVTVTGDASATVQANFALNTYTVAYNANDDNYPGTATGSTSSSSHTYSTAKKLTSNGFSRTGYSFAGWATTPTGSVAYSDGQSVTNLSSTHGATVTLYAKWTENMSSVSLVASPTGKGSFTIGGAAATSTTAGVTTTRSVTAVPIAGYSFDSWSISGGASISSTSTNPTTVTGGGAGTAATLTATFVENPVYYDVTFAVGTSYTSLGSISATNNTTSSSISSGDDILSASSVTFTASPNTGYTVEGWYTNAACTEGKHDAGSTTYTIASLSSDVTVYVKFVEKTWSVAFAAGTGGTVTTPNSTPRTVGQLTGISIAATPSTGYTFNRWTISSGSGSFTSAVTTNSNKFKPTAASTITASFNETKSTITVTTATSSQGTLKFGDTSKSWGTTASLGVATTQSITATAAAGFRFVRWDLSGAAASSSTLTNTTITLKADGSGSTGTATAVFEEDLSSPWIVAGGNKIVTTGTTWRTTADANNTMLKKTGHSTESVVYFTVPVTTVCSGDPNTNFQFKIYNTSTSKWYGLFASGSYYLLKAEDGTEKSLVEDNQNIELRAYVTGNYELKLDYSTSTPKLTVTWPVYNQVRISAASPSDAGNVGNYDLSDPVSNVRSVKRTLKANTTYTFKIMYNSDWYGYNSGTFTRSTSTSSNSRTISTSGGDMTLTTDYAGDYTFKFNQSTKALSVDFPTAYKITFGKGSVNGTSGSFSAVNLSNGNSAVTSNSTWVKSGHNVKITAPSAKSGYRFLGWYDNNSATGDAITTNANCTISVTAATTVYACYAENLTAITITTDGHGTITTPSPNSSPYSLGVTTTQAIDASPSTGYHWNTWTTSGTAVVSTPSTKSNTAKGNGTNGGTGTITATFTPNPYTITLNKHNGQSNGSISVTFDANTNLTGTPAITVPEKTGYTFGGYYTSENGEGVQVIAANGNVVASASGGGNTYTDASKNWKYPNNITLHAKWTAKQSALTFDYQTSATGYGASGTISAVSATYDAAMPTLSGTMPTAANGYAFMGFYDATGGGGTKYYNADGSSAHNWDKDTESGTTLYAYYKKAEIAAITFDNAVVESKGTVSFAVTVSPTPVGDTKLCFTVLHSNDNPLAEQPTVTYSAGKYSFKAPEASGTYKVEAVLRTGTGCDGGTELDTEEASFQVAGIHTVTVRYKCGDDVIKAATTVTGRPLAWSDDITAPTIVGYTFVRWDAGDGVSIKNGESDPVTTTTDATIKIKAIYDGTLTAVYSQKRVIYFYNTLNWENVYVYFYKNESYWGGSNQGTGANTSWQLTGYPYSEGLHGQMLPVEEGSKIYYFDAEAAGVNASYTNVAFTELNQHPCDYFYNNNKVVRRSDYHSTTMPLFVPLGDQTGVKMNSNTATYYSNGYWMNYPLNTGYTLKIYNAWNVDNATGAAREIPFPYSEDLKMPLKLNVEFNDAGNHNYWFMIKKNDGNHHGVNYTINQNYNDEQALTSGKDKLKLVTSAPGIYTFTLTYHDNGSGTVNYYIDVDFPVALNDYRIVYKDNATWSNGAHTASWSHPSDVITKIAGDATEAKKDTLSFYISKGEGITPSMKFQYASAINESTGAITWTDVTSGSITIPSAVVTAPGVYNFVVSQAVGGGISVEKVEPYTGSYYIRTDCAGNAKWDSYKNADHLMPYSEYSIDHGGYSHYYTHWVQTGDRPNIKFVVANDYSSAISDTLIRESNAAAPWTNINDYIDENGNILRNANVRFMWNQSTNKVSRAYVDGAQGDNSDNFLYMVNTDSPNMIRWSSSTGLTSNKVTFLDNGDWIYEANIEAQPDAAIRVLSNWGTSSTVTQYFRGTSSTTEKLIGGSGSDWYKIRVIYDFKTNRLISSFVPSDQNITTENAIEADVMFIREHQGDIAQLTFGENGKISKIETAYGVMRFNKWTLNNKSKEGAHAILGDPKSIYERSLFWISFPFRVKLSEVIGFGTYGTHWAVQRYDGAGRAANGYWAESSSYWRWMNRNTEYLEPNQGYLLAIDLDLLGESSSLFANTDQLEIYFPSYGTMPDITSADVTQTIPEHECTINWAADKGLPDTGDPRTSYNRTVFDSHWNVMSVPTYVNTDDVSFANTTWITTGTGHVGPKFLYTWNPDDNTITATTGRGYTYHAMHAYMVQYGGTVTWSASSGSPASIVARRTYAEQPREVEFRLELQQDSVMIDRTYVALSNDEQTSAGFRFGEDMTKEFNANKSSIYTFIANEATVAGNTLPMTEQTTVVPMGVEIKTAGDYTFAIPDGTEGIGVTLIDTETGIRTSLSALDYTVNLTAGKHDSRFVLEISPIQQMPTDIDQLPIINDQSSVKKVLIDGLLYIVKDGQLFDATGKVVTR